jgi:hypothetical protein
MYVWLTALIVSQPPAAPMESPYAETVYAMDFEQESDQNYDGWPDHWTRRRGLGFPPFLPIGIVDDPDNPGSRCLRIGLDGGGASIHSPPIPIDPRFSYLLEAKVKTEGLRHTAAHLTLTFLNDDRRGKETHRSAEWVDLPNWTRVRIGPLPPARPDVQWAIIGLHLLPTDRADLRGAAMFDDLRLARLPRLTLTATRAPPCFSRPEEVEIFCGVSGIAESTPQVLLELFDVTGRPIVAETLFFDTSDGGAIDPRDSGTPELVAPSRRGTDGARTLRWRPPIPDYGYYGVRASLCGEGGAATRQTTSLVVLARDAERGGGEFGWSLPRDALSLPEEVVLPLLEHAQISWVKVPVWDDASEAAAADQVGLWVDRLTARGIEVVGVFDAPPRTLREQLATPRHLTTLSLFLSEPEVWRPAVDPVLERLSHQIQWWQLGADDDAGIAERAGVESRIGALRAHVKQTSQRSRVGVAWPWLRELPSGVPFPSDFLARAETPAFTGTELSRYADAAPSGGIPSWITLQPLPRETHDPLTRTRDLVLRILAAKQARGDVIFLSNPFDDGRGLVRPDGSPTELFLPWCVTAGLLRGTEYLGSLQLPDGSRNHLFARDGTAVMAVWNDDPTNESLYLGDHLTQLDPWGRATPIVVDSSTENPQQTIPVDTLPTFLTGVDLALARWRLGCSLEPDELAGNFAEPQVLRVRFHNPFPVSVAGRLTLRAPEQWEVASESADFLLAADASWEREFLVRLQPNARSGPQQVRIDFDLEAERRYQFSLYRSIHVGRGDLRVSLDTWLDDQGQLVVEQQVLNLTPQSLEFNCVLLAPGRRRVRQPVLDVAPGRTVRLLTVPDGRDLIGTTLWLRMEEIRGHRVLNIDVPAEP